MLRNKKLYALLMVIALMLSVFSVSVLAAEGMKSGTYQSTVNGMNGPVVLEVKLGEQKIEEIHIISHTETPGVGSFALEQLAKAIVEKQSLAVDAVSGATISSAVLKQAVKNCLKEAGADVKEFDKPIAREKEKDMELSADVVVVGAGGAGLSAAASAVQAGASVVVIEKSGFIGGNSIVVGGFYNAPDPMRQDKDYQAERSASLDSLIENALAETPVSEEHKALQDLVHADFEAYQASDKTLFDSPNWFALQTWNGGDKLGELHMVKHLASKALEGLHWLEAHGMEFAKKVHHGGGAMYPRSHQAVLPNGIGYINAITSVLKNNALYTLLLNTEGKSLIVEGDKVVGVEATGKDGNKVVLHAKKGVVLATGGFAGNVELRQKYCEGEKWPNLGKDVGTSNLASITGDGIFMAEKAGAQLVNMDQIQILPYCNPQTGMLNDNILGSITGVFLNKEGKRFVREDGRRDEMSLGIMKQTDGVMYMLARIKGEPKDNKTLGGQPLDYLIENKISGYAYLKDIDAVAEYLQVSPDVVRAELKLFDEHAEAQKVDQFGRASYKGPMGEGPFVIYQRKTAAHHTMGGVRIDEQTHALREDGSVVKGLYCAGEITGVIHGSNRIGGNAIVDYLVFGRIAGEQAAKGE